MDLVFNVTTRCTMKINRHLTKQTTKILTKTKAYSIILFKRHIFVTYFTKLGTQAHTKWLTQKYTTENRSPAGARKTELSI